MAKWTVAWWIVLPKRMRSSRRWKKKKKEIRHSFTITKDTNTTKYTYTNKMKEITRKKSQKKVFFLSSQLSSASFFYLGHAPANRAEKPWGRPAISFFVSLCSMTILLLPFGGDSCPSIRVCFKQGKKTSPKIFKFEFRTNTAYRVTLLRVVLYSFCFILFDTGDLVTVHLLYLHLHTLLYCIMSLIKVDRRYLNSVVRER